MSTTPNFLDMERITKFLQPMNQGGMGAGTEAWIGYCLRIRPDRCAAAIDVLAAAGKIKKWCDGSWRLA